MDHHGTESDGDLQSSLAAQTYLRISGKIISGEYPPGHRLREREISEDLSVSRVPIREALPQLEVDGYITTYPRRGAVVRAFTLKDVGELFDLRLNLEVFAARKAAEAVADGSPADRMAELVVQGGAATDANDVPRIAECNTAFHAEIIAMSGSSLLETTMRPLLGRLRRLFALTSERDPQAQYTEHRALCEAIAAGKPDLAAALAYAHVELGREPTVARLVGVLPPE
ncbi:GntR family transcriptional regulator [Arthrobacter sp. 35W]|uniref:GntR family transcriptional regulator n=1 Tax=Arthrobacter sp. 35W TaxID=1132441 RepID=UPI00041B9612|nr:GntR family transcriptional regulator [Arthrobacter sp. 35W]